MSEISLKGPASAETRQLAHQEWMEAARRAGRELTRFDPDEPLEQRIAWALGMGLLIATKHQNSTDDQFRASLEVARAWAEGARS